MVCLPPLLGISQDTSPPPSTPTAPGSPTGQVTKKAKQVRVVSDNPETKAAFTNFTDQLYNQFRQLMKEPDDAWAFPITVNISGTANDVVEGATAVIPPEIELLPDGRINLQLYVRLHNRYDQTEVTRRFIQLLLYEMITRQYAGKPNAFDEINLKVPYWLVRGIDELIKHRAAGKPSQLFAGMVKSREVLSAAQILEKTASDATDPVSDAMYGASSAALVAALLDLPNGPASLRSYLAALPTADPSEANGALLRRHFAPLRGSQDALEKWWSIQIASMGQLQGLEFYTLEETETLIDEALTIHLAAETPKKGEGIRKFLPHTKAKPAFDGRVQDFENFLDHPNAEAALQKARLDLKTIGLRAFPLYRSIVLRYELAVLSLLNGKKRGVADDLKKLDEERDGIRKAMERVDDYMNYYEATQAEGGSEAYEQYRAMKEKLEHEGLPRKKDRITRYLDKLEPEFE
ncbi:MAG: hypothetical protein KDN19_17880 [Verrucomicrobiae bacterium]|nr:hypothetical protein [Verrucomicrobiae bacterium]